MVIDFTQPLNNLLIVTDATERDAGLSNAAICYQNSQHNKGHYFYAHLQPQPNGAGFAGFKIMRQFDLSPFKHACIDLRKLNSDNACFELVVTTDESKRLGFSYKHVFNLSDNERCKIQLSLSEFIATRRGKPFLNGPNVDWTAINSIGIRVIGRVNDEIRQKDLFAIKLYELLFY